MPLIIKAFVLKKQELKTIHNRHQMTFLESVLVYIAIPVTRSFPFTQCTALNVKFCSLELRKLQWLFPVLLPGCLRRKFDHQMLTVILDTCVYLEEDKNKMKT